MYDCRDPLVPISLDLASDIFLVDQYLETVDKKRERMVQSI